MKKTITCLLLICLSVTYFPVQSFAASAPVNAESGRVTNPVTGDPSSTLLRLKEIQGMDRSALSSAERKSLRKEVRSLKHKIKRDGNKGVYLSVGAIIIIILLLILIL